MMQPKYLGLALFVALISVSVVSAERNEGSSGTIVSTAPSSYGTCIAQSQWYEYIGPLSYPGDQATAELPGVDYQVNSDGTITLTVQVSVTTGVAGQYGLGEFVNAWIDWDGSGTFDSDEQVMDQLQYASQAGCQGVLLYYQETITPPPYSVPTTWMRVVLGWGDDPGPTGSWTWGDVEDYQISMGGGGPDLDDWLDILMDAVSAFSDVKTIFDTNTLNNVGIYLQPEITIPAVNPAPIVHFFTVAGQTIISAGTTAAVYAVPALVMVGVIKLTVGCELEMQLVDPCGNTYPLQQVAGKEEWITYVTNPCQGQWMVQIGGSTDGEPVVLDWTTYIIYEGTGAGPPPTVPAIPEVAIFFGAGCTLYIWRRQGFSQV